MPDLVRESAKDALNGAGLHYTRQRALILRILRDHDGHLDAYEVHEEVRKGGSKMSLSTVYRILQAFRDHGLIAENHLGEDHHHYETISDAGGETHHHAVCTGCGAVFEFALPERVMAPAGGELEGFLITELSISGICRECRQKEGTDAE